MTRRRGDQSSLTLEQQRQRFWEHERRDWEKWPRLTERQRRSPKWQQRVAQWQNGAKVGLLLAAGEELSGPHARALAPPPAPPPGPLGSPSGLFPSSLEEDVPDGAAPAKKER